MRRNFDLVSHSLSVFRQLSALIRSSHLSTKAVFIGSTLAACFEFLLRGEQEITLGLALFGQPLSPVAPGCFTELGFKPTRKMAAVGKAAFIRNLRDCAFGVHQAPAGVLQAHVAPDFLRCGLTA